MSLKYHEELYKVKKPYQYVGGEFLSANKDFSSAKVKVALAFPDKYEIGISNHGQMVLYNLINNNREFMADRVYAVDIDYKDILKKPLYALESKEALKNFDIIGFSLQYELSYPTVLKMLEMSEIAIKSKDRDKNSPIIIAGGPCCFNPLPMNDFIDCFLIGDGEDLITEVCELIKNAKKSRLSRVDTIEKLSEVKGVYCPKFPREKIDKRIAEINYENAPKSYPIPFSTSIHDRAVIEIRRGCGRMCRFCQPGHVTLPVRERSAKDIIKIAKELVHNTGYEEYSLLSLSSNDYGNIKEVIKELSCDFNTKRISVSLPSQRIDGFDLELANLTQQVRKSTMTLAPEAGSQRLRDVIKKNISEEQILNSVLTLYENGWSRVKLYFILGLPTEIYTDLDETANLLEKIKFNAKQIKKEKKLNWGLDLTCTLSVFVPKPFTPFQYCGQLPLTEIAERIHYLKEKTAHIKGLKINYHDKFVSQIEAVLTRWDKSLCKFIEKLYEKGCYLDAWDENFSKRIWEETALECEIDLTASATKQYSLKEDLPWDFINIGVDKAWFETEYKSALKNITNPTCQTKCVNCGVCKNFKTSKLFDKPYETSKTQQNIEQEETDTSKNIKYRIKFTKKGILRYFSHLDWQNTFIKALSRSNLKVAYSQGFNPTMKISLGIALPLFMESECELADIELTKDVEKEDLLTELKLVLPPDCEILNAQKTEKNCLAIDNFVQWAEYEIKTFDKTLSISKDLLYDIENVLSQDEIFILKKNKKGLEKKINIKLSIKNYKIKDDKLYIVLKTGQNQEYPALRADDLMKLINADIIFDIKRTKFFDKDLKEI